MDIDNSFLWNFVALVIETINVLGVYPGQFRVSARIHRLGMQQLHEAMGNRRLLLLLLGPQNKWTPHFHVGKLILGKDLPCDHVHRIHFHEPPLLWSRRDQIRLQRVVHATW